MKYNHIKILIIAQLIFFNSSVVSQNFEGWITYKLEVKNPNREMMPDSVWNRKVKEKYGDKGFGLQKIYYKEDNYMSQIDAGEESGYKVYKPKDNLLYRWQKASDTAMTVNSKNYVDELVSVVDSDEKEIIMGIECKSIIMESEMGKLQIWYNNDYLKMNPKLYRKHEYGHWKYILKKIGCIPLKIEQKAFMTNFVQTATDFKSEKLDMNVFKLPNFKQVIPNIIN